MEATPETLSIKFDGASRDLFMSYALLNACVKLIPNLDELGDTVINPDLRDALMNTLLTPRDEKNKPIDDAFSIAEHAFSVDDAVAVFDWMQGHVVSFFVRTGRATMDRALVANAELSPSMPSSTGTAA